MSIEAWLFHRAAGAEVFDFAGGAAALGRADGAGALRLGAGAVLVAGLLGAGGAPALAGDACSGTYMTSVLQPVSVPLAVALAEAPDNPALAASFLAGLRNAGGQIDPSSQYRLSLLFTLSTPGSGSSQGTVYNNFSWADQGGHLADVTASTVNLSAHVMDTSSYAYVWIASATCAVHVPNAGAVAGELGAMIGRTLGRAVPNGAL